MAPNVPPPKRRGSRAHQPAWRRLILLATAVLAVLGFPSFAAASVIVAIGDSFSSGEGVRPYQPRTDTAKSSSHRDSCHRSLKAFPNLLAHRMGTRAISLACAGAKSGNVGWTSVSDDEDHGTPQFPTSFWTPDLQLTTLRGLARRYDIALVTITIGGNDLGFSGVLRDCALAFLPCAMRSPGKWAGRDGAGPPPDGASYAEYVRSDIAWVRPRVRRVYQSLRDALPDARIVVVGYPHLFPALEKEQTCSALRPWAPSDQDFLNAADDQFNLMLAREAAASGVEFVDVRAGFRRHEPCGTGGAWMSAMTLPLHDASGSFPLGRGSFHPRREGQLAYARFVYEHLGLDQPGLVAVTQRHSATPEPSINGVTVRMRRRQVEARLGGKGVTSRATVGNANRVTWYPELGVGVAYSTERRSPPAAGDTVAKITTVSQGAHTDAGVGVGSTVAELLEAYPWLSRQMEGSTLEMWSYQYDPGVDNTDSSTDTTFTIHDGKVASISVGHYAIAG